jgi:hypothetical protein
MKMLVLIAATLAAAQPIIHQDQVTHEGTAYQVSYRPHVTTEFKTIGMSVGSRQSTEQCRWTARVVLEREIHGATGERLAKRLPGAGRVLEGYRPGRCDLSRASVEAMIATRLDKERDAVLAMAQADRPAVLADISAAHALALN